MIPTPQQMNARNNMSMEGIGSQISPQNSLVQFDSFDLNNQTQNFDGYTVLATLRGTPINGNVGFGRDQAEFEEQFPISGPPLANFVASTRNDLQDSSLAISEPSIYPLEILRSYIANGDFSSGLNPPFASTVNYACDEVNAKGVGSRLSAPLRTGFQVYSSIGDLGPNNWISSNNAHNLYSSSKFSNELSLSLATSQPSGINGSHITDQCSEISCSGFKETKLGSEQTSSSSKELSLSCGSNRSGQFLHVVSGSRYLQVIQEILAQIASYSLENLDQFSFSTSGMKAGSRMLFSSGYPMEGGARPMDCDESLNVDGNFEVQVDPALQKRALEAKKTQLLTLLQLVDDRYNQCLDEIHTVVSAFHAATELDPQVHTRIALQTISIMYKSIRERISNHILAMGSHLDNRGGREAEESPETCYFQKQWTIQQLKKREHQLWRPQRGLPERSVSVLRAWMFQNFLHPYPKDAEKHLLAVNSGLTRSQVSNWFINARVRLWKPMIEEMYAEMKGRKGGQGGDEGSNQNQISISNLRFQMN